MTKEEFEKGIGRELKDWEDLERIEKVYCRVKDIWNNEADFMEWYELQGFAVSGVIDRYVELIDEYDMAMKQLMVLHYRVDTIQKFIHITE